MRTRRQEDGEAGVSAVEFGLVLPIFIVLLAGIIDYGYLFYVHLSMVHAAREGVRVGVTYCPRSAANDKAQQVAEDYLKNVNLDSHGVNVLADASDPNALTVEVRINVNPLINLVPFPPNAMTARASMRWEYADAPADLCTGGP